MDWNTIGKYATGLVLLASVFFLVWMGKVDASVYIGLATSTLGVLGYHVANQAGVNTASAPSGAANSNGAAPAPAPQPPAEHAP